MVSIRAPKGKSFKAKKGTFKARAKSLGGDVDFFGQRWASSMGKFLDAVSTIEVDAREMFIGLTANFFDRVQLRTPRRTGRALSSWRLKATGTGANYTAVIWNGIPYIVYLEFGWSKQAPKGMVRITLAEMDSELKEATRRLLG